MADQQGRELAEVAQEAGAEMVSATSLKAAARPSIGIRRANEKRLLPLILNVLHVVENWVQTLQQEEQNRASPSLEIAQQIKVQDVETNEQGKARLIKGVAKVRRISIEEAETRHRRKSRSIRVDGYKRHVLHDLDTGLIRAVGITPANNPEASVTREMSADLERQPVTLKELHIDRASLSSHLVRERSAKLEIYCKAWPVRSGKYFHKQSFTLDWERHMIRCSAEQEVP